MTTEQDSLERLIKSPTALIMLIMLWAILSVSSYFWHYNVITNAAFEIAKTRGEMMVKLADIVIHWNIGHHRVYVPQTKDNPPNPYLTNNDRDTQTLSGLKLTQLSPSQMITQLTDGLIGSDTTIHLTSDNVVNPDNAPLLWEREVLSRYQSSGFIYTNIVEQQFRYMAPLTADQSCLDCHSKNNYAVGDTIGGVSITFPAAYLTGPAQPLVLQNLIIHLVAFLLLSALSSVAMLKLRQLLKGINDEIEQRGVTIDKKTKTLRREIKQHKEARSELQRLTVHDPLTGIRNRRHFLDSLAKEVNRYQRYQNNFSLLMLDLDHFKQINDTCGHDCGDHVLKEFAARVQQNLRQSDIFVRYGGEEFAIIATNASLDSAKRFAEKLTRDISQMEILWNNQEVRITVSIGVANPALLNKPTAESLISLADKALSQAKKNGRNRAICASPQTTTSKN